jgi:hypothetical protein
MFRKLLPVMALGRESRSLLINQSIVANIITMGKNLLGYLKIFSGMRGMRARS